MGQTPDRHHGPLYEEGMYMEDVGVDALVPGEFRYYNGAWRMRDSVGVYDPRAMVTPEEHGALRQLIHFIESGPAEGFASGAYFEALPSANPFPTSEIWWESAAKLKKIVSLDTTWNANKTINTETWKVYDASDGSTVLVTVTDTHAYSGPFLTSTTRAIA